MTVYRTSGQVAELPETRLASDKRANQERLPLKQDLPLPAWLPHRVERCSSEAQPCCLYEAQRANSHTPQRFAS
jgi:hypothetical protein